MPIGPQSRHFARAFAWCVSTVLLAACARSGPAATPAPDSSLPRTRAERSGYTVTSSYADVRIFLDSLRAAGAPIHMGSIGRTVEGREIPFVIASRPLVRSPEEARSLGRPIVYVQGNIHAGEVEGKEALQALLRDLTTDPRPNVLDSIVLIAIPIYNADGNEKLAPQARNRSSQNGPELVGTRANAQGLNLNRDYVKAEAPETRASLAMFDAWEPDVFMDLHTSNGSYHGYALTYSPSLSPAAREATALTRDELLPELRRRVRGRRGFETFDYGNFAYNFVEGAPADTTRQGWYTYDHRPRYGTNYFGLRDGISFLSEAYSHDPFERRVASTYAFVDEVLSLVAERAAPVMAVTRDDDPVAGTEVAVRGELTRSPREMQVVVEMLERVDSGVVTETGVRAGLRRTGDFRAVRMPVFDRFDATLWRTAPAAYLLGPDQGAAVQLLRLHGIEVEVLSSATTLRGEGFVTDSVVRDARAFEGHSEVRVEGRWRPLEREAPAGSFLVSTAQPLGLLAAVLLEPESDDGLTTWNVFDAWLQPGGEHPVVRVR